MSDTNSPYSPLKIFHHQDRLQQLRDHQQTVPLQVQLIISDLCNQDCSFCAYRMSGYTSNQLFVKGPRELAKFGHNNPKRMIPYEKVIEILDDCVEMGVKAIQLTGGGEPTVHPRFVDIVCAINKRGLDLGLVTNGLNLRPSHFAALVDAKWIRVSIDAGSAETYAAIRRVNPSQFQRVWSNVRHLCRYRSQRQKEVGPDYEQKIGIGFVVTKDNHHEIIRCASQCLGSGVDNMRISAVFQSDDDAYFNDFFDYAAEQCRRAESYSTGRFKVFNLFGDRIADLAQRSPDYQFCGYQQLHTYIGGDLNLYRCCNLAYNERGLIGSLSHQRFKDLWKSQWKKTDFENFDARDCTRCQFNNKNRTILYAISDKPRHVNFV